MTVWVWVVLTCNRMKILPQSEADDPGEHSPSEDRGHQVGRGLRFGTSVGARWAYCQLYPTEVKIADWMVGLKETVHDSGKRLLIIWTQLPIKILPPSHAPETMCWLAEIVYGSVWTTVFPSRVQPRLYIFYVHTLNGQLEDHEEQLAEFDKNVYRISKLWSAPLSSPDLASPYCAVRRERVSDPSLERNPLIWPHKAELLGLRPSVVKPVYICGCRGGLSVLLCTGPSSFVFFFTFYLNIQSVV